MHLAQEFLNTKSHLGFYGGLLLSVITLGLDLFLLVAIFEILKTQFKSK